MSVNLTYKLRNAIDRALNFGTAFPTPFHKGSDLLFPNGAVIEGLNVTPGAALNVNVSAGYLRVASGQQGSSLLEVKAQTNQLTFVAPSAGNQTIYTVSYDPVGLTLVATAGTTAAVGSGVAGVAPAGQVVIATVDIRNGDTTPAAARINNLARIMF